MLIRPSSTARFALDRRRTERAVAGAASREGGVLLPVERRETVALLNKPHTRPMVMRNRELAGWIRVDLDGVRTKRQLTAWVRRGVTSARSRAVTQPGRRRR